MTTVWPYAETWPHAALLATSDQVLPELSEIMTEFR